MSNESTRTPNVVLVQAAPVAIQPEIVTPPPDSEFIDELTLPLTTCEPVFQTGCGSIICPKCGSFLNGNEHAKKIHNNFMRYTCNRPYACDAEFNVYGNSLNSS